MPIVSLHQSFPMILPDSLSSLSSFLTELGLQAQGNFQVNWEHSHPKDPIG